MKFEKAIRMKAKLRLALTGPSGSGKTHGALQIAKGIGGRIALIDTEAGSASLYSHMAEFDVLELEPPYAPERFIEAVKLAEQAGFHVLIIDSITHEWNGVGGCLELVDQIAKAKYRGNAWSAWAEITPRHRAFLDALMRSPLHVIATMRSKTETAQVEENGRKKVAKLGMKAEQRDGAEYEFTTVLDLVHEGHFAVASKDRTGLFGGDPAPIDEETGRRLLAWLEEGADDPRAQEKASAKLMLAAVREAKTVADLKSHYEAAIAALPEEHHRSVKAAKNARYRELNPRQPQNANQTENA